MTLIGGSYICLVISLTVIVMRAPLSLEIACALLSPRDLTTSVLSWSSSSGNARGVLELLLANRVVIMLLMRLMVGW